MFVNHRISAVPVVDDQGKVVNIYAKFDVIVSIHTLLTSLVSVTPLLYLNSNVFKNDLNQRQEMRYK